MAIVKFWPRWMEEFEDFPSTSQRGLKIHETEQNLIVEAVVAGIPEKDIDINIEDGVLTIKAEKKEEKENENEFKSSSYQYYYTAALSGGQWDKANADFEHGVVTIKIPKAEAAKPRKILIKSKTSK